MRTPPLPHVAACAVLLLGSTALSAQSTTTFQLPPDPDETTRPQAEGPVDTEGTNRAPPRVIGTPTPTPSPAPAERATSTRDTTRTTPTPTPGQSSETPTSRTGGPSLPSGEGSVSTRDVLTEPRTRSTPREAAPGREPTTTPSVAQESAPAGDGEEITTPPPTTLVREPAAERDEPTVTPSAAPSPKPANDADGLPWPLVLGLVAALIALLAVAFAMIRRRRSADREPAEQHRPEPSKQPAKSAASVPAAPLRKVDQGGAPAKADAGVLEMEVYAVTLSRSVMNATISYRLTILNRGDDPISLIRIAGDVTSAHGRIPVTQQIASVEQSFPELHTHACLEPGERATMQGELRLPLREVRAIRQGSVPVFVPLLRLTVHAENMKPRAHTYVIGSKNAEKGARPNPFRLDEPPRSYAQLTTSAVA